MFLLQLAAVALACSPRDAEHTGTYPSAAVPTDARLVATMGAGLSGIQAYQLMAWGVDPSIPVTATGEQWCVDEGSPSSETCYVTLSPEGGWADGQTYRVELHTDPESEVVWSGEVTGVAQPITAATGAPGVEVRGGADLPYPSTCDYQAPFTYSLGLLPAFADASGLSMLKLYRGGDQLVGTWWAPTDGAELQVDLTLEAATSDEDCFYLVQEDASGTASAASPTACLGDPGETGDPGGDTGEDDPGSGCSMTGGGGSGLLVFLGLLAVRRRSARG